MPPAAQNFVFPLPPPPPPPPATNHQSANNNFSPQPKPWQSARGGYSAPPQGRGGFRSQPGRGNHRGGGRTPGQSGYSYAQRNAFREPTHMRQQPQLQQQRHPQQQQHQHPPNGNAYTQQRYQGNRPGSSGQGHSYGQKRAHDTAFPRKQAHPNLPPKVQPAPSVPSFGAALPIPTILPKSVNTIPGAAISVAKAKTAGATNGSNGPAEKKKKGNLFGLTPNYDSSDVSSDEEVLDEEGALPSSMARVTGGAIRLEYKGQITILKTPQDYANWVRERRKNFSGPGKWNITQKARQEELRQLQEKMAQDALDKKRRKEIAVEKKAQAVRARAAVAERRKTAALSAAQLREKESSKREKGSKKDHKQEKTKEQLKIEKLRKAMEKNAKILAKLEASAAAASRNEKGKKRTSKRDIPMQDSDDDSATISSVSNDSETSSSGSSSEDDSGSSSEDTTDSDSDISTASIAQSDEDEAALDDSSSESDSDAPPEESSISKKPVRAAAPARKNRQLPTCNFFQKYGSCKKKMCPFRHEPKEPKPGKRGSDKKPPERMSLYQRLLKQQIEEDERAAAVAQSQSHETTIGDTSSELQASSESANTI